jgi:hypothetical protein
MRGYRQQRDLELGAQSERLQRDRYHILKHYFTQPGRHQPDRYHRP